MAHIKLADKLSGRSTWQTTAFFNFACFQFAACGRHRLLGASPITLLWVASSHRRPSLQLSFTISPPGCITHAKLKSATLHIHSSDFRAIVPAISRHAFIAVSVVALHVGFIYALYSGLLLRAAELVVPVELLSQFIEPPQPVRPPPPQLAPRPPPLPPQIVKPQPRQAIAKAATVAAPLPIAIADPTPSVNAPLGATTPQPVSGPIDVPVAAAPAAPVAPPATAAVQLPSSDATYLQNPRPPYPAISRRLNEQGNTTVRVLIGADGQPQRAEITRSSGFARLDDAAVKTVMAWRYVPGKRGGVAETMWFNVPINWVLE